MHNKLILFDIDWTLLRGGLAEHIDGFSYAWEKVLGVGAKLSDWPDHHGQPDVVLLVKVPELCHNISHILIKEKIDELKKAKIEYFLKHKSDNYDNQILPGVKDLLSELKKLNISLTIKSGNLEKIGRYRLEKAGIADYFIKGGWGDNVNSKAEAIGLAIKDVSTELNVIFDKKNIYDVGDSKYDIEADKSYGITSIGVCSGYDDEKTLKLAGANFVLKNLTQKNEFLKIIQN